MRLTVHILELKEAGETYLVPPQIAMEMPGEVRLVTLLLTVNRQGTAFLWPLPEPALDGRDNQWSQTARVAASHAQQDWVRIVANMNQGFYDMYVAQSTLGNPEWPDKSMRDLLALAFGENFIIRDANHPVLKRLRGEL